jgi:hypothetical protein
MDSTSSSRSSNAQELREALCGHASKAVNVRVYGDEQALPRLHEAVQKLDYGIDIPPFVSKEEHEISRRRAEARHKKR